MTLKIQIPALIIFIAICQAVPAQDNHTDNSHSGITIESTQKSSTYPSLESMVGQMIMVGTSGTDLRENILLKNALNEGIVGGVILFEKNISPDSSAQKLKKLTLDLQQTSRYPLLIAIDQEGGRVNRLKTKYGFPASMSATALGYVNNPDTTFFYGERTAQTLYNLGININFAPVVDLCTNPYNPVIAKVERCYSSDPEMVTKHAAITIKAHHENGVLTALKHFPGHGSSKSDTHLGMTDITNLWNSRELIPYKNLISSGLTDAIMTAHIVNCKLDSNCLPATLSEQIIQNLLRDSLQFEGVVFTDDMQMHAITKYYGLEKSILLAMNAGVDILLFSNNISGSKEHQANVVHATILQLVQNGKISEDRIKISFDRICTLKKKVFPNYPLGK